MDTPQCQGFPFPCSRPAINLVVLLLEQQDGSRVPVGELYYCEGCYETFQHQHRLNPNFEELPPEENGTAE
jgi:hypothetical protein